MFRTLFVAMLATAALGRAQAPAAAAPGSADSGIYTSPTGAYKIEVPVLPALGGRYNETENVVTFRDSFGLQITIGAFSQDATQRWEMSTRGIKDYLIYFFGNFVLPDFKHFCEGAHVESAGFSADFMEGALFTYLLLPGGSVFSEPPAFGQGGPAPVAKRGNLIFVKNGFTFVISTELSEKVTEGSRYHKTIEEENQILRSRLVGITKKMQFTKPSVSK